METPQDQQWMRANLQGASDAVATTIRHHTVDRAANTVRTVNRLDPAAISRVA